MKRRDLGPVEHLRADEDAEQQLEEDARDARLLDQVGEDRREHGRGRDDGERGGGLSHARKPRPPAVVRPRVVLAIRHPRRPRLP